MRRLALSLVAVLASVTSGCTSSTDLGPCLGVQEDRDPGLVYKVPVGNVVVGVIFMGTVIVPLVVLFDEIVCPVARKTSGSGVRP